MKPNSRLLIPASFLTVALFILNFSSCSAPKKTLTSADNIVQNTSPKNNNVSADSVDKMFSGKKEMVQSYLMPEKDSIVEVTLSIVGDLMCHMPQANNSKTDNGYDFNPSFEFVKDYLSDADVTIGNLELTTAGTRVPYSGYPNFNAPDDYIPALKQTGFDFLVTSNNHSMDTGEEGLLRTIDQVKTNKLGYSGTFSSQADHDSIRILNIKGIKIAVLNYTYGTNGAYPSSDHKYMLNVIDSATITNEVKKALLLKPDYVMVYYHYGTEYQAEPIESQRKAVSWARDAGANILIGGHPHVVGPCKWLYPDATHKDTCFVAWSMGNFFSNQNKRYTDAGVVVTLHIQKNLTKNTARLSSAEFLPTWVYRGEKNEKKRHIIFPAEFADYREKIPSYLDSALVNKMRQAFNDTKLIVNKYGPAAALKPLKP